MSIEVNKRDAITADDFKDMSEDEIRKILSENGMGDRFGGHEVSFVVDGKSMDIPFDEAAAVVSDRALMIVGSAEDPEDIADMGMILIRGLMERSGIPIDEDFDFKFMCLVVAGMMCNVDEARVPVKVFNRLARLLESMNREIDKRESDMD